MSKSIQNAIIYTNFGNMKVDLYKDSAPKTVENFVGLSTGVKDWTHPETGLLMKNTPLYKNIIFHRIISNFMIQTGDPIGQGIGGPGYCFDDEIDTDLNFDKPYVVAMANAGLRNGKGTNGSQFFITSVPTPWLYKKHTIFGSVADDSSKNVVDTINNTETDNIDKPLKDIIIKRIEVSTV